MDNLLEGECSRRIVLQHKASHLGQRLSLAMCRGQTHQLGLPRILLVDPSRIL